MSPEERSPEQIRADIDKTREELGDSSGGKRIDLESGKVRIRREETAGDDPAAANGGEVGRRWRPTGTRS